MLRYLDKRLLTNLAAIALAGAAYLVPPSWREAVLSMGLFALSGAITNWLAIYMLFEKVPGIYGSGVVPLHFEDFKRGIHELIMHQFFSSDNIDRFFFTENKDADSLPNFTPLIEKIDLNPAFDSLVLVIDNSQFAPMLSLVGGTEVLQPLRVPFMEKLRGALLSISETEGFRNSVGQLISEHSKRKDILAQVSSIVEKRLEELTPRMVKEIVERMIHEHLGWLVVWGGVFGALLGLLSSTFFDFI